MSEFLNVMALAILQGIAEFLPISSSGHLVAAQHFLGFSVPGVSLELALHAGTLVSVCVFYFATLRALVLDALQGKRTAWMYIAAIALSMVPCGIAYAMLGDWLEEAFENIRFVGPALMATGILLLTTRRGRPQPTSSEAPSKGPGTSSPSAAAFPTNPQPLPTNPHLSTAFFMGLGQMVAMLPGVSRSGTTIWVARLCRVAPEEAARFSFLMSLPVTGGATLLKALQSVLHAKPDAEAAPGLPLLLLAAGALMAAIVGYVSLVLLVRVLNRGRFWMFGAYCLLAGLLLTLFS